ncbi:MAG: hypothetical protein LC642_06520, partial [Verrucomicrobiaceae bacterium]|nr:hypothetical protein [Verrucomicrobiaceae bacterium]
PRLAVIEEGDNPAAAIEGAFKQHMGIDADKLTTAVAIAVAGSEHAVPDVTEHRASIAADFIGGCHGWPSPPTIPSFQRKLESRFLRSNVLLFDTRLSDSGIPAFAGMTE